MSIFRLPSRRMIRVSGAEARPFLQGLLSVDVLKLRQGELRYGLLLTPQGKFLHDMFIAAVDDSTLLLDVDGAEADALLKRLKLYKLKRDVTLEIDREWQVYVVEENSAYIPAGTIAAPDPRLNALGKRIYAPTAVTGAADGEQEYLALRVAHGVPEGADMIPEKSFPLDFDMDDLHAIDYAKGCYVGQEVTARMHYRSEPRKGVYLLTQPEEKPWPPVGTEIMHVSGKVAGVIASHDGRNGIAMLRHELADGALLAADVAFKISRPIWAKPVATEG